jgi:hypothetical protein
MLSRAPRLIPRKGGHEEKGKKEEKQELKQQRVSVDGARPINSAIISAIVDTAAFNLHRNERVSRRTRG